VRFFTAALAAITAIGVAGCANTLPEQDRRILETAPTAKLSTDDIWKDYQENPKDADTRYWGRAVEVSGKLMSVVKDRRELLFGEAADNPRVRALLLDDQAESILGTAAEGQRIRLKCFCAGVQQAVILKSCVKP
jgi:hypothetical protein